jgi:hypothetical protein
VDCDQTSMPHDSVLALTAGPRVEKVTLMRWVA